MEPVNSGMICSSFEAHSIDIPYTCANCGMHRTQHSPIGAESPPLKFEPDYTLADWWAQQVESDISRTAPKISEYGTKDLEAMGRLFAQIRGIEWPSDVAAVWGIMFYAQGKIARAIASLERGEMPSEDTLFDLSVYAMMARSYRERGKL